MASETHSPAETVAADLAPSPLAVAVLDRDQVRAVDGPAGERFFPTVGADGYRALGERFEDEVVSDWRSAAATGRTVRGVHETDDGDHVYHVGLPWAGGDQRLELFLDVGDLVGQYERLDRFESLIDRTQDGLVAATPDGTIRHCNASFAQALQEDPAELRGLDLPSLVPRAERERYRAAIERVASGQDARATLELPHETGDWGTVPLSVTIGPIDADRRSEGVVVVTRDVSERRERERRLERYRRLVDHAADPMWVLDGDGDVVLANPAMEQFLDVEELAGRAAAEVIPATAAERLRAATAEDVARIDVTLPTADGTDRRFEARVGEMPDSDGSVATFRDVTERERRRAELDHLQQVYGDVVTEAVHRSVRAIEDRAETLAEHADGDELELARTVADRANTLATIAGKCGQVQELVQSDPTPSPQRLDAVLDTCVAAITPEHPAATVEVDVPADLTILGVESLDLALANLIDNACRHAGEAPSVRVSATVEAESVRVTVADDGPGIAEEELAVLDRGAETVLEHGSGVGLWLVDWVVEKSAGELVFDTGPDGTRAHVTLDRYVEPEPAADDEDGVAPVPAEVPAGARRILHVDPASRPKRRLALAAAEDDTVAVHAVEDVEAALTAIEMREVDCVVSEHLDRGWDRLRAAVEAAGLPHVLYTDAEAHAESTLTAVDSLVEKGGPASAAFLLEKVRALTADGTDTDTAEPTPPARLTADLGPLAVDDGRECRVVPAQGADPDGGVAEQWVHRTTITLDGRPVSVRIDMRAVRDRCDLAALYHAMVERAGDGVSIVDADGRITYHNRSFADLLGHADMVGDHSSAFMAEGQLEQGQLAVQRILSSPDVGSEVLDMDFVRADGEPVTLAVHFTVRREDGEYAGLVNVARDVTERKQKERRLDRYRQLVEHAADPMFAVDGDGAVVLLNDALATFLGADREALLGEPVADLLAGDGAEAVTRATERIHDGRDTVSCEGWLRDGATERRCFAVTASATDGAGAVCTLREVTERRQRADELVLLKSVLGRVLRHNLRNELTVITGHAGALADRATGERAVLAREIVRLSQELNGTAERARAVEDAIAARGRTYTHDLGDLLAAADAVPDLAFHAAAPTDTPIPGHPDLPLAVETVARTVARWRTDDRPVRLEARRHGDRCELVVAAAVDPTVDLAAAFADVEAAITRADDVGAWLAGWIVEVAGGEVEVDPGPDETRVTLRLRVTDEPNH